MKAAAALLIALLLGAAPAFAAGSAGTTPFQFLLLDANARAVAMGGAYTALASDANALLYNPAGLARVDQNEATFMHNSYYTGVYQEYAAYASPKGWGANVNYLNSGSVQNTTNSNPNGTGLGTTGLTDMAFSGGYGRTILDGSLSLGGEFKYIREDVASVTGAGGAFDFGALYSVAKVPGLTLGAAIQNIGPTVKFDNASENLPLNLRGGAGYAFDVLGQKNTVSLDLEKERGADAVVAVGAETVLGKVLPIRLGFTSSNGAGIGITTGIGWIYEGFAFDYAFVPFGDLGNAHRVSVTWRWGASKKDAASEEPAPKNIYVPASAH